MSTPKYPNFVIHKQEIPTDVIFFKITIHGYYEILDVEWQEEKLVMWYRVFDYGEPHVQDVGYRWVMTGEELDCFWKTYRKTVQLPPLVMHLYEYNNIKHWEEENDKEDY